MPPDLVRVDLPWSTTPIIGGHPPCSGFETLNVRSEDTLSLSLSRIVRLFSRVLAIIEGLDEKNDQVVPSEDEVGTLKRLKNLFILC